MKFQKPTWPNVRDGILFFAGLAGVAYETVWRRPPDYGLLPVFAAMCGLPAFIKKDKAEGRHSAGHVELDPPNDNALGG